MVEGVLSRGISSDAAEPDFRSGSKGDLRARVICFCSTPKSGHRKTAVARQLSAMNGLARGRIRAQAVKRTGPKSSYLGGGASAEIIPPQ